MNKKPKLLSVIIPVYNAKLYLERCVKSVLNQTYCNIEIILVDDGSTDGSDLLCDNLSEKDERIIVIHKSNGGLSDARNVGIRRARGVYIGFIDADDWIDKNMYSSLMSGCEKSGAEIAYCNKVYVYGHKKRYENIIARNEFVDKEKALLALLLSDPSACSKIFKKELFRNVKFPDGVLYEDIATVPYLIDRANGVYMDVINGYFYNQQNSSSIVHGQFSLEKMDYYYNAKRLNEFIMEKYPNLIEASERFFALSITVLLTDIYKIRKEYKKEYKLLLKDLSSIKYKRNRFIPFPKKVMICLDLSHMGWIVGLAKQMRGLLRRR